MMAMTLFTALRSFTFTICLLCIYCEASSVTVDTGTFPLGLPEPLPLPIPITTGEDIPVVGDQDEEETIRDQLSQDMLRIMGLPRRPHHAGAQHSAAPDFMRKLYASRLDRSRRAINEELRNYTIRNWLEMEDADTVIAINSDETKPGRKQHKRLANYHFKIHSSSLPESQEIGKTELRIYKQPITGDNTTDTGDTYLIKVYQVSRGRVGGSGGRKTKELTLLDTEVVELLDSGWLVFDVTKAFSNWMVYINTKHVIQIQVVDSVTGLERFNPNDIGISENDVTTPDHLKPFLSAYLHNNRPLVMSAVAHEPSRSRRSTRSRNNNSKRYKGKPSRKYRPSLEPCSVRPLTVTFRDLKWEDWIVAPDDFKAGFCDGQCVFPMNSKMNATNHAIVQTLVHIMNPGRIPGACCVPNAFDEISILYFDDTQNVVLRLYKEMSVISCGCH
uniref:Bone morphogenetic protein Bmp5-8 n=1 Tax=Nemertoderma westbladi TaxID=172109 RepID=A0A2P1DVF4_9BILA|nr:bone morphogenetic protein Bmp5-8 [Nemertoderma westbladi]